MTTTDGQETISTDRYTYDVEGRIVEKSRRTSKPNGGTIFDLKKYDSLGRLIEERSSVSTSGNAQPLDSSSIYEYGADGRLARANLKLISGIEKTEEYKYDSYGNLKLVTTTQGSKTSNCEYKNEYDSEGRLQKVVEYDESGEVEKNTEYIYEGSFLSGKRESYVNLDGESCVDEFEYDENGILTKMIKYSDGVKKEESVCESPIIVYIPNNKVITDWF